MAGYSGFYPGQIGAADVPRSSPCLFNLANGASPPEDFARPAPRRAAYLRVGAALV